MLNSALPVFVTIFLPLGLFLAGVFFGAKLMTVFKTGHWPKKILAVLSFSLFIIVFIFIIWVVRVIFTYQSFTYKELIAIIKCAKSADKSYNFSLYYTPLRHNQAAPTQAFLIRGDQWSFGGDILRWHPWLTTFGAKTRHKPTRISGRFVPVKNIAAEYPTEYDINQGTDRLWIFLHHYQRFFPFVEAVYGNSVYTFPDYKHNFKIYITPSGYLIKRE